MEVRLVEVDKNGKYKNVEVYRKFEFLELVERCIEKTIQEQGFLSRLSGKYPTRIAYFSAEKLDAAMVRRALKNINTTKKSKKK